MTERCPTCGKPVGKTRSLDQNRLMWKWMTEAADQLKDDTPAGYHAFCKLHFGIPILREDEDFRADYDAIVKPLDYEKKLKAMSPPIDFEVTRLMKTGQLKRYLDDVYTHFTALGVRLTDPDDGS